MNLSPDSLHRWDERAQAYSVNSDLLLKTSEQRQKWAKLLQYLLDERTATDVLDVGTGPGFLALQLARLGHRTTGVDRSVEMLRIAKQKANAMKLNCTFVLADAASLPFVSASFGVVISRHLLGGLSCPEHAFMEWKRVLEPGGKIVVMDGDRLARNRDPFARILPAITRQRFMGQAAREKLFGAIRKPSLLQEQIVSDLARAGFVGLRIHTLADLFPNAYGRLQGEHYQRVIVTGRSPDLQ